MAIATTDPFTGQTVRTFQAHTAAEIEEKLDRAQRAFQQHRRLPVAERARLLERAAAQLTERREQLAGLMTLEMGKLRAASFGEVDKCALCCRYYAENGARLLATEEAPSDAQKSYVRYDPLGPVLAVMPWNFPLWQVIRFAAPALLAGNVGLLKHASNVPQTALALEEVFLAAGFPPGCFQTLLVPADAVKDLIADPRIVAATLTGSEGAGRSLAEHAGRNLKKVVLELGGSDPFLVFPSADLDKAVQVAVQARVQNAGQSCIAAKRFLLHAEIAEKFEERFVARLRALKVGDPRDERTELGPLANRQVLEEVDEQVRLSVALGAKLLCGGERLPGPGFFYPATALREPPPGSPARDEELFGPVATIFRFGTMDGAVALANETRFGLGASCWTRSAAEQEELAARIEAGMVFFNGMVKSDPRLPFGGVKASGHGRELARNGLLEFLNAKSVWVGA